MYSSPGSSHNKGKGRYWGKCCPVHPEMGGLRMVSKGECIGCRNDKNKRNKNRKRILARARAKYKQALAVRTPSWADTGEIRRKYKEAKEKGMTIDHIIPLRGALVSGLHIGCNLQLLSEKEGNLKGNIYNFE